MSPAASSTCPAPPARGRRPCATLLLAVLAVLAVLAGGALASTSARAGDPEMARFLLKGAKADVAKKAFDAAFTKLQRAEAEDPTLLETVYWLAFVYERRDDPKAAVAAYRRFVAGMASRKAGATSRDEAALVKKATERVNALAAGEGERRKLDDAFVEALLGFARGNLTKDPVTAAEALQHVVDLRPDHVEAKKLLARLGVSAKPPPPASAPADRERAPTPAPAAAGASDLRAVRVWKDLLKDGIFKPNDDWVMGADGVLSVQHHGGMLRNPLTRFDTLPSYALEVECRVVEAFDGIHGLGFGFAFEKVDVRKFYALFVSGGDLQLIWVVGDETAEVLKTRLPAVGAEGWRRIGVVVHGVRIEVFVDGERIAQHEDSRRTSLVGEPTIFVQNCRGDIRSFRLGTPP